MMQNPDRFPQLPGCYLYKDRDGSIVYVGKAKNLRARIQSYFREPHDEKTKALVSNIHSIEVFATSNEVEALILENNLIKKHQPRYNISLKDSRRYAYLLLTDEEYPRLVIARSREAKGRYFGPFVSAAARDNVLNSVIKIFGIRTCRKFPKRACLRYSMGLCSAPCEHLISRGEYQQNISRAEIVLKGKVNDIISKIAAEMEAFSARKEYELALSRREKIESLRRLGERQAMERFVDHDEDVLNFRINNSMVYLMLFHVKKGILLNKQEFEFPEQDNFLEQFIVQYYSENQVPKEIILPVSLDDAIVLFLERLRGSRVSVTNPVQGTKKNLLLLVDKNIEISFFKERAGLEDLQDALKLEKIPSIIDCFDISHLSGTNTVASMVQFRQGRPFKSQYRRFRIRTVEGIDDFAAISEVVRRRYLRVISERIETPSLIVIDGGKGQLHAAYDELQKLGLRVPVIGLAKRLEEVFVPGLQFPLPISRRSAGLLLLERIRDEAHRFALSYNRLLRKKSLTAKE